LIAANDITQQANANITTTSGSIDLETTTGTITMDDNAIADTGNNTGNIRLSGSGGIQLGGIHAGTGDVSLISSSGSILDNGDTHTDVQAVNLRIEAGVGIGQGADLVDVNVDILSAAASSGGIFINEESGLTVSNVGPISVNRVGPDSQISTITDAEQSDLTTISDGAIVLNVALGNITLTDGNDSDSKAIFRSNHRDFSKFMTFIASFFHPNKDIAFARFQGSSGQIHSSLSNSCGNFFKGQFILT
jgi:hypothetical protein